mmetsp:Transcript_16330/g.33225  ORF Transcript_16330/g.33225 Transcript_16330/m.33225 type:complete len:601 (-) Transcript_16330:2754-4556(-)
MLSQVEKTCESIAVSRAIESMLPESERLIYDPYAVVFAGDEAMKQVRDGMTSRGSNGVGSRSARIAVRTRYFDDFLRDAIRRMKDVASVGMDTGRRTCQVVLLGAGLDSRAWRMEGLGSGKVDAVPDVARDQGVVFFEVDTPGVLKEKADRLASSSQLEEDLKRPRYRRVEVPVNLAHPPRVWTEKLCHAGFDSKQPSVWILEGLLYYFEEHEVALLLLGMLKLLSRESVACASLVTHIRSSSTNQNNLSRLFRWACPDPVTFFGNLGFEVHSIVRLGDPAANYGRWPSGKESSVLYVTFGRHIRRPSSRASSGPVTECHRDVRAPDYIFQEVDPEYCNVDVDFDGTHLVSNHERQGHEPQSSELDRNETSFNVPSFDEAQESTPGGEHPPMSKSSRAALNPDEIDLSPERNRDGEPPVVTWPLVSDKHAPQFTADILEPLGDRLREEKEENSFQESVVARDEVNGLVSAESSSSAEAIPHDPRDCTFPIAMTRSRRSTFTKLVRVELDGYKGGADSVKLVVKFHQTEGSQHNSEVVASFSTQEKVFWNIVVPADVISLTFDFGLVRETGLEGYKYGNPQHICFEDGESVKVAYVKWRET